MSRMRIITKLRKNTCFQLCTKLLDDLGLAYEVHPPTGKGHPFFLIQHQDENQEPIRMHMALTPKSKGTGDRTLTVLRAKLRKAGIID